MSVNYQQTCILCPCSPRVGALSIDGRRLSVCLLPDCKSRMEGLKIDRKEAHGMRDPI